MSEIDPIILELSRRRVERGISQAEIGRYVTATQGTVARWESGQLMPTYYQLCDYADCVDADIALISREES